MGRATLAGGMRQVLGASRFRRDRLAQLADALDDPFLQSVVGDQLSYAVIAEVLPARRARTFDVEVDELHNLVADDVVVHNCAPPFKQAEFDILYGVGISREGSLIDVGVEHAIIRKSGAWYTYEGDQLGQGKENARKFLRGEPGRRRRDREADQGEARDRRGARRSGGAAACAGRLLGR